MIVKTPGGVVEYAGNARVDGVPGTAAPILCNYLNICRIKLWCAAAFREYRDLVDGVEITCIDNGMPEVLLRAADLGITATKLLPH